MIARVCLAILLCACTVTAIVLKPKTLARTTPVSNPMSTYHKWMGNNHMYTSGRTTQWPVHETYARYYWSNLETSKGVYDFKKLEDNLRMAAESKQKHGFRIMLLDQGPWNPPTCSVPPHVTNYGWWWNPDRAPKQKTFVPDWNSPQLLAALADFIKVVGNRYNNDKRVAFVDIGLYGIFGEWHLFHIDYTQAPTFKPATVETMTKIANMMINAFPNKQLLMGVDTPKEIVSLLMKKSGIPVGVRADCLGLLLKNGKPWEHWRDYELSKQDVYNLYKDRWKVAPFVAEWCVFDNYYNSISTGPASACKGVQCGIAQVRDQHVATVDAGQHKYAQLNTESQKALQTIGTTAGYRYSIDNIKVVVKGSKVTLTTAWNNAGVTPTYIPWKVSLAIKNKDKVAWSGVSKAVLLRFLPGKKVFTDSFNVPKSAMNKRYDLYVTVKDAGAYYQPMTLANAGRKKDGSYLVGSFLIGKKTKPKK